MPTSFPYLVRRARAGEPPRGPDDAVESRYKLSDLTTRPVVRDELNNCYLVFESRKELADWYAGVPEAERCCHEVVFGRLPQRLKFDIDAPAHKLDALPDAALGAALRRAAAGEPLGEPLGEGLGGPADADLGDYLDELLRPADAAADADAGFGDYLDELLGGDEAAGAAEAGPAAAPDPAAAAEAARAAKARGIVALVREAVLDELYVAYYGIEDIYPARESLAVTDSSGPTRAGWKYSYHLIVVPYAVPDNEEAKEFTARVLERLPAPVRAFVDPGVNNRTQCFRLVGSAKPGTGRYKRATPEAAAEFGTDPAPSFDDLLIVAPSGARVLPRVYTEEGAAAGRDRRRAAPELADEAVRAVLALAAADGATAGHAFREARGTLFCFDREAPSGCRLCGEVHHNDNTLMLCLEPAGGPDDGPHGAAPAAWPPDAVGAAACRVVELCRHARGRGRVLGELELPVAALRARRDPFAAAPAAPPGPAPGAAERLARHVEAIREGRANPHDACASDFERLPAAQRAVYAAPEMRDYELVPTLAVRAPMKTGKTKALARYLEAHFPADGLETPVVRVLTFRQTFSRSFARAFPGFTLYSDVPGDLDAARHPRLIVQVESLHRLKMGPRPEPADLLVLDEVESILAQFNSGLHRHFAASFAMFEWLLRTAHHVVCMDANLGDRTYRTLLRMRPAHPPHFHWNRVALAADDVFRFTADQGAWLEQLWAALRAGRRVVLPTNSLTEARAFEEAVRREFPGRRVMLYSSETSPSEKARHFADVHTHWGGLDVLIYTPTCSAGVSFELEHFDELFGFFRDGSCDVETSRQMLARVRNLRARTHTVCLVATGADLPTAVDDIRRLVYDKRAALYRRVGDAALPFEYGPDGEVRPYESAYSHLWLENVRVANLSRNDFARRFVSQVADTGAAVEVLAAGAAEGAALLAAHRDTRDDLRAARCEAVAAAADLAPEEAAAVREALRAQADVAPAQRLAYEKYQLRDAFAWHGRPLGPGCVAAYGRPEARRVYRALRAVTEGATVLESLRLMQRREADHYAWAMESRPAEGAHAAEGRDLLRDKTTYVFQAHHLAVWLLGVCGYSCVTDTRHVLADALEARLRAALPGLRRAAERLVFEFEIPRPNVDRLAREPDQTRFLAGVLRTVNAVLRAMYGLELKRAAKRAGGHAYSLGRSAVGRLFVFSQEPEPDDAPDGARPHIASNLRPHAAADARVDLFLEEMYYAPAAGAPPAAAADRDADPDPDEGAGLDALLAELLGEGDEPPAEAAAAPGPDAPPAEDDPLAAFFGDGV